MCGILFVAELNGPVDRARFGDALNALAHRGPDGDGEAHTTLAFPGGQRCAVAIGHRRLSILDPRARSSQPFRRDAKALTYNGEIYNFRALRADLPSDVKLTTDGDTEVLFEILRRAGVAGLEAARGMWAFCYLNEATGQLIAARDRLGKKPLFYFANEATLCFASEIGAIMTYLGTKPRMTQGQIDTYLAYGWTLPGTGEATPIAGIKQVRPGSFVTIDLQTWVAKSETYFDMQSSSPSDQAQHGDLSERVRTAVLDRLVSDRKVGLLLSGGVDSSLILSVLVSEGLSDQVHCFTGDAGKSEDADYAARITKALGVKSEVISLGYGGGAFERFLSVCRHQEKPFPMIGNVLGLPQLYEEIAARDVPVVLDGTGADEIFGGYWERYYRFALAEAWTRSDHAWTQTMLSANADVARIDQIGRTTVSALRDGSWPPRTTVGAEPTGDIAPQLLRFSSIDLDHTKPADSLAHFRGSLAQALHHDVTSALLPEWLWQNDRNAMRSGVENRSPFLDTALIPRLDTGYRAKFVGPWNKHELRVLFDRFRPAPTQWRREKQGFRWAFARFLRQNRAEVLELIAASTVVGARVRTGALIDAIAADEELLFSDLVQRCLCVAGVEAATGLTLA